jgi:hypothetical protein
MRRTPNVLKGLAARAAAAAAPETLPVYDVTGQALARRWLSVAVAAGRPADHAGRRGLARDLGSAPFAVTGSRYISLQALQPSDK